MNVYLTSLGCKLNQAEIESLAREMAAAGFHVLTDPTHADWAIVNTCAVTQVADRKSRQLIRGLRRRNPALCIAVTGCSTASSPREIADLEGVALVVGNGDKARLLERLREADGSVPPAPRGPLPLPAGRTRALVKVQDGCDNACTYCFVRLARGAQRSRPPDAVLGEVRERLDEGYREIVLTGVHIGAYGRDSAPGAPLPPEAGWSLARLVRRVLCETAVGRVRLSSIEPQDLTDDLLALWGDGRLCRHVHLPIQSGSDAVLRRMGRAYDARHVAERAEALRRRAPDIAITTDVMVGFPGETDEEFAATMAFVEAIGFSRLHVFRFSPRPGTAAARMEGRVSPAVARARSRALIERGRELALNYHRRLVGRRDVVALLEERAGPADGGALWTGLTDTYVRVRARGEGDLGNRLVRVACHGADPRGVSGTVVEVLA